MDAQKFGAFLAQTRKEQHLTQAELAKKIHVTDKAVSRWERGIGFPDIHTLEPLAAALQISVLELMQSQKVSDETVPKESAVKALSDTVTVAKSHWRKLVRRLITITSGVLAAVFLWFAFTGMVVRKDVYIVEYSVLPSGNAMAIGVGIAGSMGYIRDYRNVSQDPTTMELQFFSAFGGLNSRLGARNTFLIPLDNTCTHIYISTYQGPRLVLVKNNDSGIWERVQ